MPVIKSDEMLREEGPPDNPCGPNLVYWISEVGGLTQFGAFIEELPPGSRSSIKHWHSAEDEFIYVLEGSVTLVEGDAEAVLAPGDAATFRAGDAVGHYLENRSASTSSVASGEPSAPPAARSVRPASRSRSSRHRAAGP